MAVYEIAASTTLDVSPDDVWAVLDDFGGWPTWMPAMQNLGVELLSAGEPRVGYRFRLRGALVHADLEVTRYEPLARETSFRVSFPPITGSNRCVLVPLEDRSYRIERVDRLHLPAKFIGFLDRTQRARFERLACEFVTALKRAAERRAHDVLPRT